MLDKLALLPVAVVELLVELEPFVEGVASDELLLL